MFPEQLIQSQHDLGMEHSHFEVAISIVSIVIVHAHNCVTQQFQQRLDLVRMRSHPCVCIIVAQLYYTLPQIGAAANIEFACLE